MEKRLWGGGGSPATGSEKSGCRRCRWHGRRAEEEEEYRTDEFYYHSRRLFDSGPSPRCYVRFRVSRQVPAVVKGKLPGDVLSRARTNLKS